LVGGAPALDQKSRPSCDSRLAPKPEAVDRARLVDKLVADKRDALIRRRAPKALPVRVRPVRACARRHAPGRAGARGNARTASPWRSAPRRGRAALPSNNARRRQRLDAQCPHARVAGFRRDAADARSEPEWPRAESRPECLDPNWGRCAVPASVALSAKTAIYCCSNRSDARPCRKSGECRITLSLPSPRSKIHDKSAPT